MVLTLGLCLAVGISLGLLGAGGSVLTVPIFVYSGGMSPQAAISLSLLVVSITSLIGSVRYLLKGWVNLRLAAIFIVFGSAAAAAGSQLSPLVTGKVLMFFFGGLMLVTGMILLVKEGKDNSGQSVCQPRFIPAMLVSCVLGVLTGFLGVGGGFLIVPVLSLMMKCSMKASVGTSLLIISVNAMAGFAGHAVTEGVDWQSAAAYASATALGVLLGSWSAERVPAGILKKGFALLIMSVGIFVIIQNGRG